jgi:rhamnosyltransferase
LLRLMLDSGSSTAERAAASASGFELIDVAPGSFDHGGTRQEALLLLPESVELVIFLTQDAIPAGEHCFTQILDAFADPEVGAAWGRQLPQADASVLARHAREFNYPPEPRYAGWGDRARLGIKAAFCSDSFAAYRVSALRDVGGFPSPVVFGEDMHVAARMLKAGWTVAYAADACVLHSHNYSLREEFARYFDTGAFHSDNPWLLDEFGAATGEGRRFVISELRYLARHAPLAIPRALARTAGKLMGYKLGQRYRAIPARWRVHLGMNKGYWKRLSA